MAAAARLSDGHVLVFGVGEGAHRRSAFGADHPHLGRGKSERHDVALLRDNLDRGARGAPEASALAGDQLDVVDDGSRRDLAKLESVTGPDVGAGARLDHRAYAHALGGEDVALGAVRIVEEGDVGGAIRVVLDRRNLRRHAVFEALEIDLAVTTLGAAAAMARGDAAARVAPAGRVLALGERLVGPVLGDLLALLIRREAPARAGRFRLAHRHQSATAPSKSSMRSPGASFTIAFFHERVLPE